jgi:catechol 2,3-dioxygenase-like lactoylglutathione lyase family enzyme
MKTLFVAYRVTDLDRSLDFYTTLGYVEVGSVAGGDGVAHNLSRHHFRSKEGVWHAVVEAADAKFVESMRPVLAEARAMPEEEAEAAVAKVVRGMVAASAF